MSIYLCRDAGAHVPFELLGLVLVLVLVLVKSPVEYYIDWTHLRT